MKELRSGERHEFEVSGAQPQVIEMPSGWSHEIENIGDEELLCVLWANEVFDQQRPDTFTANGA